LLDDGGICATSSEGPHEQTDQGYFDGDVCIAGVRRRALDNLWYLLKIHSYNRCQFYYPGFELVPHIFEEEVRVEYIPPTHAIIAPSMEDKTQIIHLSDLHIGYKICGQKASKIIKNIVKHESPSKSIIVITGDIVEQARRDKDLEAALKLIEELRKHNFRVLLCPGNHDYGTGLMNNRKIAQNFRKLFLPQVKAFPQIDIIKDTVFIGLDSNAEELHWYDRFFADGELGEAQLARLNNILSDPFIKDKTKVLYLHHHPFHSLPLHQLKDSKKLKAVIENKIDIFLYGHLHFGRSYNKTWGIRIVLDGGSSTGKRAAKIFGIRIKHRVIDLTDFSTVEKNYLAM
jgi:predicted MPP superfamily phosphohydrolase